MGVDRCLLLAVTDAATPPLLLAIARWVVTTLKTAVREEPEVGEMFRLVHGKRLEIADDVYSHASTLPAWLTNVLQLSQSLLSRGDSADQAGGVPVGSSCAAAVSLRGPDRESGGDDSPPMSWRAGRIVCQGPWGAIKSGAQGSTQEPPANLIPS